MVEPSDFTRWVGTTVAIIGAFVVAPDGAKLMMSAVRSAARRTEHEARALLGRRWPRFRKDATVHAVTATRSTSWNVDVADLEARRDFATDRDMEDQLERLRGYVETLFTAIEGLEIRLGERFRSQQADLDATRTGLTQRLDSLGQEHSEAQRRAAAIDARAVPVVGLGIVLTALPDEISSLPRPLWIAVLVGPFVIAVAAARQAFRDRRTA